MGFAFDFIAEMARLLFEFLPLLLVLAAVISVVSIVIGRSEGWAVSNSLYFGFITATIVGYGDMRPTLERGKFLAIILVLMGLVFTGIIVAIAVEAAARVHV